MPLRTVWLSCLLIVFASSALSASQPAQTELNGDPIDSRTYRAWVSNYRMVSRFCAVFEEDFVVVPNYDRRVPSSRGITRSQATEELTVRWRESSGILSQGRSRRPAEEEVRAYANAMPDTEVGSYGDLHSVEIVEILGPDEMLVKELWLIDVEAVEEQYDADAERARDNGVRNYRTQLNALYEHRIALKDLQDEEVYSETHRLVGYPTRGLSIGERWDGPDREGFQVALARWETPVDPQADEGDEVEQRRRRRRWNADPRLVLVNPVSLLRHPLEEDDMVRLLDARGHTIVSFVEAMREIRERFRNRDEANDRLARLLLPAMPEEE